MAYSTYHNHTTFCDGKSTAEEMVLAAIAAGCEAIGFSGHCYTWFDETYCMSKAGTEAYKAEIHRLRDQYGDRISILCGVEQDYWSQEPTGDYDFIIGSVHYVKKDGCFLPVDNSKEELLKGVNDHYNGDILAFCEDYYRQVSDVQRRTGCTFVGHFDLVTKFNEDGSLFDMAHPRYVRAWEDAVKALCRQGAVFEMNTGAMAKDYRTTPYPAVPILEIIRDMGSKVILNADCHDAGLIQYVLEQAETIAKKVGVKILTKL